MSKKNRVIIQADQSCDIKLEGYNGFKSYTIADLHIDSGTTIKINPNYQGFVLLSFNSRHHFPLILSKSMVEINLQDPTKVPRFINSPENDFLYEWLGNYNNLENRAEILDNSPFPFVSTLLNARLLNESTIKIKTFDELNDKKAEYATFIKENFSTLKHSDMLMTLARQYLMMNEYVTMSKQEFSNTISEDSRRWIEILSGLVPAREVVAFLAGVFYERSMVTQAANVIDSHKDVSFCGEINHQDIVVDSSVPDLLIVNSDKTNKLQLKALNHKNVLSFVSDTCIFSKVVTIMLARQLLDMNTSVLPVVVPMKELKEGILEMDKMFEGELYFALDEGWREKYFQKVSSLPLFILFDESNKAMLVSNDRNEIMQACKLDY